jgi:hypothetical protein
MAVRANCVGAPMVALVLLASGCSGSGSKNGESAATPRKTDASPTTIRIPVLLLTGDTSASALAQKPEALAVLAGGPDEPPQGPTGFEVSAGNGYLVSDPVRKRVALFDAKGAYTGEWLVGFPVETITATSNGSYRLHPSDSSADRYVDAEGRPRDALQAGSEGSPLIAKLLSPTAGVVEGRPSGGPLNVAFESGSLRLISIEPLGIAPNGASYVALEASGGGEAVSVQKIVRAYSPAGQVTAEIDNIPLDYEFAPADELKVRRGVLYQLWPSKTEIRINRWSIQ